MLTIFGAVAELERDYTMQRQAEGIAIAKENGVYSGDNWTGRQRTEVCPDALEEMYQRYRKGRITVPQVAKDMGLSVSMVYRRFAERKEAGKKYNPNVRQTA